MRYLRDVKGLAMAYIMSILVLLIALTATITRINKSNAQFYFTKSASTNLVAQANIIRERVLACAIMYPNGDNGTGFHIAYPGGTGVAVSTLTCPGSSVNLWTGIDGAMSLPPITGFGVWTYANDATSVRISITTTSSAGYGAAMTQALARFNTSANEASIAGSTFTVVISQ